MARGKAAAIDDQRRGDDRQRHDRRRRRRRARKAARPRARRGDASTPERSLTHRDDGRRGALATDELASGLEEVGVTFRALSDDDIERYIDTGEPMDKAGAYGIQGFGATIVERVDGDYFAVMGLALNRLVRLCRELGLGYAFGPLTAD